MIRSRMARTKVAGTNPGQCDVCDGIPGAGPTFVEIWDTVERTGRYDCACGRVYRMIGEDVVVPAAADLDLGSSLPPTGARVIKLGAGALCPYCNVRQIAEGPRAVCSDPDCQRRFREAVERFDAELMAGPPTFLAGYRTGGSKS